MKHFRSPYQTAESYFCHTERWDQEEPSFPLLSPILLPSPKICQTPSLRQHQSLQQSPRNIHSPFFSLFFPSSLSFGSLYMDPTLSAWPPGKWHIWAEYHGYSSAASSMCSTGQTEGSQWMTDWIIFFFFWQTLHVWTSNQKNNHSAPSGLLASVFVFSSKTN